MINYKKVKKINTVLLVALMGGVLVGCTNIQAPEINLNDRLNHTQEIKAHYVREDQWWAVYQDPQLNQLIEVALKNNIDYAQSAINVNKALYQAKLLGADLVPSFSGKVNASVSKNVKDSTPSSRSFGGELALNYELDLWQKLADSANAQQWEYKATLEDREAAKLVLVNNIVDAYYHLSYLKGAIKSTQQNIDYYQKIQSLTKIKYQLGKVDSHQYTQASQSVLSAQNTLLDLQSQFKTTEQALRDFLNLKPAELLNLNYPDLYSIRSSSMDLDVPLAVLANRPDLKAAEYRLQKAFKNARASEKSWFPSINLGASLSSSSSHARTAFNVPFTGGNVGIDLPFLKWNTVKWNVKISQADYESSRLNFEKNLTTALNEVDAYHTQYTHSKITLNNLTKKLTLDIKSSRYYKIRYENGANELSDWLNALNTENSTKMTVLNNRYQLLQYENMLYKAMAGRYRKIDERGREFSETNHAAPPIILDK